MSELTPLLEKLCELSRKDYSNPYSGFDWPGSVDREGWYTSPELISLYGTEFYERLPESQRKLLSFYEAVNFFSLNIHGERSLVEGLAARLYRKSSNEISPYLHHFLDEENKHMVYFGSFCAKYAGMIYPDCKVVFPREYAPGEEDFLFFARVLIFEEIVDVYNVRMSIDERLHPLARRINAMHHRDEARHLAFGRKLVKHLFDTHAPAWKEETLKGVRAYLADYLRSTWREYYNPSVYKDAGLPRPYDVQEQALACERCRAHRREVSRACVNYLLSTGILVEEPQI